MPARFLGRAAASLAALLVVLSTNARAAGAPARPHILFLLADDLGWEDVSFNGGEIPTPNIDSIAQRGAKLTQHYVQPTCTPTRSCLMTGQYPIRNGLQAKVIREWHEHGLSLERKTLAQGLKEAGYETAITGKWHLGNYVPAYQPTHRGFDHQYGNYLGAIDYFTHRGNGALDWHRDDKACYEEGYSTHLIAKEAARLVAQRDQAKPLFLYVPFNAVHTPVGVPESYKKPFGAMKEPRRTYAGMVAAMDEAVGQILAAFDQAGMTKDALIVFCSDNGGPSVGKLTSNGPYRAGKGSVYEGGVRVCSAVRWDGHVAPGTSIDAMVHMVDWYPTLLTLAGAKVEQSPPLDGMDIEAVLTKGAPTPHTELLVNSTPEGGAVRVGDWKLVVNGTNGKAGDGDGGDVLAPAQEGPVYLLAKKSKKEKKGQSKGDGDKLELFNIAIDPYEKTDLAEKEPQKLAELRARYDVYAAAAAPVLGGEPMPKGFKVPTVWGEPDAPSVPDEKQ